VATLKRPTSYRSGHHNLRLAAIVGNVVRARDDGLPMLALHRNVVLKKIKARELELVADRQTSVSQKISPA
jgi:hypothetical protein